MKKSIFFGSMVVVSCFMGCTDDDFVNDSGRTPAQAGDEIVFATKVSNENSIVDADTRTAYGERSNTGIAVNWERGDRIMIHCDEASAPASKSVEYEIDVEDTGLDYDQDGIPEGNSASGVMKVNTAEAGLQWGDPSKTHYFMAFYPAGNVVSAKDEIVRAEIPVVQNPVKWIQETASTTGADTYFGEPDMNNAFMYAHTEFDPQSGNEVSLQFQNLLTVLDITLQGPTQNEPAVTLSSINVEAYGNNADNISITGQFDINVAKSTPDSPEVTTTCTPVDNGTTSNRISISCYNPGANNEKGGYITLQPGQNLNVKAYLLPNSDKNEAITPGNLQIVVNPLNNDAPRIKYLTTRSIVPHKVNRVLLPKYSANNKTNYWMTRLDPNVYASELSLPGSKLSVARADISGLENLHFQGSDIATQFQDGVRAFNIAVRNHREGSIFTGGYTYTLQSVVESKDNSRTYYVEDLSVSLATIHDQLVEAIENGGAKNEFAFVQLVWCSDRTGDGGEWLEQLSNFIRDNAEKYGIYTGTFNEQTTIGELEGKIVIMLNINNNGTWWGFDESTIPSGDNPILYAYWSGAKPARYDDTSAALPVLCWSQWNNNSPMKWYASEATLVGSGSSAECTWEQKKAYAQHLYEFTLKNHEPGVWVMNDLGGFTNQDDAGGTLNDMERVYYLTRTLNNGAVQTLQTRDANASLGIIYMNFADMQEGSGVDYQSDWLIQTIIDNNFKFPMQMRPVGGGEQTVQYNASYSQGGNAIGWD